MTQRKVGRMAHLSMDESPVWILNHNSDKEEYDKLGSESGSAGTLGTGLGGLLRGVRFTLGVTLSANKSCGGDWGSLALP